jgi:hypothetical protein
MMKKTIKTIDDYFVDWESKIFGYGYGAGEEYVIAALKKFMEMVPMEGCYEYKQLECELSPTVAWLLINILCKAHILEYGSSPRHAWLTNCGRRLKEYLGNNTLEQLENVLDVTGDYTVCYPDVCNCGPTGYQEGLVCQNPFWIEKWKEEEEDVD